MINRSNSNPKAPKKNIIDLEPVQIDVQLTQKIAPFNHVYHLHIQSSSDPNIAQKYDKILTQSIQTILLCLSQGTAIELPQFNQIINLNKVAIDYIAVLNLQIIQKLTYILQKCSHIQNNVDKNLIESQIKYWKQFVFYAMSDYSQEVEKYGPVKQDNVPVVEVKNKKSQEQSSMKCQNGPIEDEVKQTKKSKRKQSKNQQASVEQNSHSQSRGRRNKSNHRNGESSIGNQIL